MAWVVLLKETPYRKWFNKSNFSKGSSLSGLPNYHIVSCSALPVGGAKCMTVPWGALSPYTEYAAYPPKGCISLIYKKNDTQRDAALCPG